MVAAKWLTLDDAAQRLALGTDDVQAMIRSGRLPGIQIDGAWHVRSCDVEAIAVVARGANLPRTGFEIASELMPSGASGVPSVNVDEYDVDPSVLRLLDRDVCSRFSVLPVSRGGSTLVLAMADPTDKIALDEVKFRTGLDVEPVHAPKEAIESAIDRQYDLRRGIQQGS